jgi:hypothetical protein
MKWTGNDPLASGLARRFGGNGEEIAAGQWNHARAAGDIIGACRNNCTGLLVAEPTGDNNGSTIDWYETRCLKCGHITAAPNGRTLARSSRHSEMPDGWWHKRMNDLRPTHGKAA